MYATDGSTNNLRIFKLMTNKKELSENTRTVDSLWKTNLKTVQKGGWEIRTVQKE